MRWWAEQTESVRSQVRSLVARGQLEFVNGGLVQHDEATSHHAAIVDQLDAGMRCARPACARAAPDAAASAAAD